MSNESFNLLWRIKQWHDQCQLVEARRGMVGAKVDEMFRDALEEKCRALAEQVIARAMA